MAGNNKKENISCHSQYPMTQGTPRQTQFAWLGLNA